MLGLVMRERLGIAVSGTHGKSTTSAMIAFALAKCGLDPSFVIGGTIPQLGGGSRSGKTNLFVAEACEFDRSFHNLYPRVAVITNIDRDHLDCYGNLEAIVESFRTFARRVPRDGLIVTSGNDANVLAAMKDVDAPIEFCALRAAPSRESASDQAKPSHSSLASSPAGAPQIAWITRITRTRNGCYCGEICYRNEALALIQLSVPGEHNLLNATMAVAACRALGVDPQRAADAIGKFTGVDRRMSEVGRFNGAIVVDDYGHHPTEIRATLKALQREISAQTAHLRLPAASGKPHAHAAR